MNDNIGRIGRSIKTIFSRKIYHRINIIVLSINAYVSQILAVIMKIGTKTCGLAGS